MEYKGKIIKNERPTFWETMLLLTIKRQDFVQTFFKTAKYCLDLKPEPELEQPKPKKLF
jgi:hypothetical protein